MEKHLILNPDANRLIRKVDFRLMSYNIEMTEVTGGTFWKAYTPGQIAGTEEFRFSGGLTDFTAMEELMQYYPPIDLHSNKLRHLAKQLGPAWVRVSGSWATKTYYDFEGTTGGKAPEGYFGAFYLFFINTLFIALSAALVTVLLGVPHHQSIDSKSVSIGLLHPLR